MVTINNDPSRVFRTRVLDSLGNYTIAVDSGTYDLNLRGIPAMWSACSDNISFNTDFEYKYAPRSFGLRPTTALCPQLDVNVSTPYIRACSTSIYRVRYCNNGSATAQNTYVTLQLDSLLNFQNATIPSQLVGKRLYRFDIGSVAVGKCGGFDVRIAPDCGANVKEGQTLCVKAHIYPDAPCFTSPNWSGASLKVEASCDADSLRFSVQNIGTPSSGSTISSIVIVDDVVFLRVPINTNTGLPQALPTLDINNGYTYRVIVPQVPNHPGISRPTLAVEGCRKNSTTPISLGKVNEFPEDDFDPFVDKECQVLRGAASVNNELNALPVGYQNLHKIEPTDEIEYQINFRNRTADTAFTVAVRDTLSAFLDPLSVELGASSHPYRFQMFGGNLMKFTFDNINLPPNGATDKDESAGFVKFRVKLKSTIPNGTRILNAANISTNFGIDAITNETFHTIGQSFVLTATIDPPTTSNVRVKVYPNPFSDKATFEIEQKNVPPVLTGQAISITSNFSLYDATGRLVRSEKMSNGRLEFERQNLPVGFYVFKIEDNGKLLGSGKLIIKN
jgi:Secretion system C-terminal sorting domain